MIMAVVVVVGHWCGKGGALCRDSDMAGACFGRFADVVSEMRIGTELEDDATALDLNGLRGEFVYTVRAVGAGLGLRSVELADAAPGFRALEWCCTGQDRNAKLGLNTITDAGIVTRVARVLARERKGISMLS